MRKKKTTFKTLTDRCRELGYKSYDEYLRSPKWKLKRKWYLKAYGSRRCWCCGAQHVLQVHHKTYTRLGKERLEDLVPICRQCHVQLHDLVKLGAQLARAHSTLRNKKIRDGEFVGKADYNLPFAESKRAKSSKPRAMSKKGAPVAVSYVEPWSQKSKRQR